MRHLQPAIKGGLALATVSLFALFVGVAGARADAEPPTGFQDTVVFEDLQEPTVFRFAPDGRVFVALKGGKILVFENLEDTTPTVFADLSKQVFDYGDKGILGLALDPKFDEGRPYVYALYTYDHELGETPAEGEPGWAPRWGKGPTWEGEECPETGGACVVSGRLVRLTAELGGGGHAAPSAAEPDEDVLLEDWCQQFSSHSIGDLEFGPEGALFVSGGEGASFVSSDYGQFGNPCGDPLGSKFDQAEGGSLRAQDVRTPGDPTGLDGTVLRVNADDGEAWPGNPLASSSDLNARKIIGYGFRNPFRFTIDRRHDEIYVGNVGNGTDEEIDRFPLDPAQPYNSGWPCYEGLGPEPGFEGLGLNLCESLYEEPGSTSPPFFYFRHGAPVVPGDTCPTYYGSAISGSAFYEGSSYPAKYKDALFFADAVRGCIYVMRADAAGEPDPLEVEPFLAEEGVYPAVDIEQGPEGDLFYASLYGNPDEGSIHRISYDPGAPQARLGVDQAWGAKTKTFEFDASGSTGHEGDPLEYDWDLDGDGTYEVTDGAATQSKQYSAAENVRVAVQVTDKVTGRKAVAKLTVYPGDSPPQINIVEPEPSETWGVGQAIDFAGNAYAKEGTGAKLPSEGLYWKVRLLHCPFEEGACHEHPLQVFPATEGGEFLAPDHDYPSALKIYLTATDSRGLSATGSVEIKARPVTLGLGSSPPGVTLTAGLKIAPAPFQMQAVENSPTTISAPATASVAGVEYAFDHWSDAGERVHTVVASGAGTYTAFYRALDGGGGSGGSGGGESTTLPQTTLLAHPPKHEAGMTASFRFSADLAGSWFQCALDGGPYRACLSPRVYRNLRPGKHSLELRALTGAGNPDPTPVEFSWSVRKPTAHHSKRHARR